MKGRAAYLETKPYIYIWRARNPEKNKEVNRRAAAKSYAWKKIAKQFRLILIDEQLH
jgi:hypothetical protein